MEIKICKTCLSKFEITDEDLKFYDRIDVPTPKNCPDCRLIRRLEVRNAKTLYARKCDATGENIISPYHSDHKFPVYKSEYWWSDKWDALDYGKDFDFTRPFFEQFKELQDAVPHFATFTVDGTMENSEYTNCAGYLKNCYLIGESDYNEDCYYANRLVHCTNVVDCSICYESELCYECIDCQNCYNLKYSQDCITCRDSMFLYDCKSCKNCIGCINQRQKQYMIFNKQYTKEEYEKMAKQFNSGVRANIETFSNQVQKFFKTQPHKHLQQEHLENSFGDHLYNAKNSTYCFDCKDLEDCKYCAKVTTNVKDCMDYNGWGIGAELIYQCSACGDKVYNMKFCSTCVRDVHDCEYCEQCVTSSDCFGCFGLKSKKYCIFNKQYTKEDYSKLKEKIIKHMRETGEYGEFFPQELEVFGYNETIAMDYFPLTKEEALKKGFKWTDKDRTNFPQIYNVPADIQAVPDAITSEILACEECSKNYKITAQELKFYRQINAPVPVICPTCRHVHRQQKRNPKHFWDINCAKCGQSTKTTFDPKSGYIIYCQDCYNNLIL